ncbi:MAG: hypothetical protein V2I26_11760, partial [Halieaceae bacterium]|nr:hypothetical protein [Halieaceae bacterium]
VLLVLTAIEELIVGWYHDKTVIQITDELLGRGWLENLAPILLMLLILIPLVTISEIFRQLGPEAFKRLWLEAPS